jgi:feruloyl esterase
MKKTIWIIVSLFILAGSVSCQQKQIGQDIIITKTDLQKVGISIPVSAIGEPVGSVKLYEPRWVEATETTPAYGVVEGSIFPVDPQGWPINFRVLLPASWSHRSMQQGGGGINGTITVREGINPMLNRGFAMYGSDSGHQASMNFPGAPPVNVLAGGPTPGDEWALNEEAIKNLAFMQMKKTHDAAMVIIERVYGSKPAYNYYIGTSQGGREALTVAQRYPADYDGIIANVPIVNFSSLMLGPELIRIQEIPLTNWVTPAKVAAIKAEFMRQCDGLDGIYDGIISNYVDARAIFNVNDGIGPDDPWAALRAPDGVDPDPEDTSTGAKLTDGQIKTLELSYSSYMFATPLANGVESFGMWMPTTEPNGFGMITGTRYKGQEGAGEDAPMHSSLGILGVTAFLMQDLSANPLDYVEGGKWNDRREEISEWLDSTDPDLSAFYKRGGKIIMTIGTIDNVASCGAQIDYYQSLLDEMGREKIDEFARLYVVPQAGHGLSGRSAPVNGEGNPVEEKNIPAPNAMDNMDLLMEWVENDVEPSKTMTIDEQGRMKTEQVGKGYLMCSYPNYQKYVSGPADDVASYTSAAP